RFDAKRAAFGARAVRCGTDARRQLRAGAGIVIGRERLRRVGVAFAIAGIVLSTVDVNPAGEIHAAYAEDAAQSADVPIAAASPSASASPAAEASPSAQVSPDPAATVSAQPDAPASPEAKGPQGGDLTHLTFTATDALTATLVEPADGGVADS